MTQVECPFCSNPDFLAAATKGRATKAEVLLPFHARQEKFWRSHLREYNTTVTTDAEKRGEYVHTSFYGDDFESRWGDFTVEVIGIEAGKPIFPRDDDRVIPSPPTPFFFFAPSAFDALTPYRYHHFFIARITHGLSNIELIVHWWPTHGRLFEMRGKIASQEPNDDIEAFKTAFGFFQRETRGAEKKITDERLKRVLSKLGAEATQEGAAKALKVSGTALEKWRRRQGIESWRDVVNRYSVTQPKNLY